MHMYRGPYAFTREILVHHFLTTLSKKESIKRRGQVSKKFKWFSKKHPWLKALEKQKKEEKKLVDLAEKQMKNLIKKIEKEKKRRENTKEDDESNFREL